MPPIQCSAVWTVKEGAEGSTMEALWKPSGSSCLREFLRKPSYILAHNQGNSTKLSSKDFSPASSLVVHTVCIQCVRHGIFINVNVLYRNDMNRKSDGHVIFLAIYRYVIVII